MRRPKFAHALLLGTLLASTVPAISVSASTLAPVTAASDPVLYWNAVLLDAVRSSALPPPRASRLMAMVHTAVYDAVNAASGSVYKAYINPGLGVSDANVSAAAAAAAYRVLVDQLPAQQSRFDAARTAVLSALPNSAAVTNGLTLGQVTATNVLSARFADGANTIVAYTPGTKPGDWQPTPAANAPALLPNWPTVTPWTMTGGSQFRPDGPPALNSAAYTAAYNEVKDLGSATSTSRTADQTAIAKYWADGGGTATPPGHWLSIASDISQTQKLTTLENARLFAMLSTSVADAAIVSWDAKYADNFWRPITAIRNGETDTNPDTVGDATWTPLLPTPPFPTYTSGHSTFSAAAAEVLSVFFGDRSSNFCSAQELNPGISRCWGSFAEAAMEAGMSRIYGGIHFQFDNVDGLASGKSLGNYVATNFFAVPEPGSLGALGAGILAVGLATRRRRATKG